MKRQLQGATAGSTKVTPTLSKKSATKDLILPPFFPAFPDYSGMYEGINCSRQCLHESLGSQVVFQVFWLRGPFFFNIKLPSLPLWAVEMRVQVTPKWSGGRNRTRSSQNVTGVAFEGDSKPNVWGRSFFIFVSMFFGARCASDVLAELSLWQGQHWASFGLLGWALALFFWCYCDGVLSAFWLYSLHCTRNAPL